MVLVKHEAGRLAKVDAELLAIDNRLDHLQVEYDVKKIAFELEAGKVLGFDPVVLDKYRLAVKAFEVKASSLKSLKETAADAKEIAEKTPITYGDFDTYTQAIGDNASAVLAKANEKLAIT